MTYFDGYSSVSPLILVKLDRASRPLRCKPGFEQRGSACQLKKERRQPISPSSRIAIGVAAVGFTAAIAAPALTMVYEVRRGVSPRKGKEPPRASDLSKEEIQQRYDDFKPGDVIQKTFEVVPGTRVWHYAVYTGKNKETGEHEVIDVHNTQKKGGKKGEQRFYVGRHTAMPQASDPKTDSIYQKMPDDHFGSGKITDRKEILARAEEFAGMDEWNYSLGSNNCEVFARGVVENSPISRDGTSVSLFSQKMSSFSVDQIFRAMNENRGLEIPEFQRRLNLASKRYHQEKMQERYGTKRRDDSLGAANNPGNGGYMDLFITDPTPLDPRRKAVSVNEFVSALGVVTPAKYQIIVNNIAGVQPSVYQKYIRLGMMRDYCLLVAGESVMLREALKNNADSWRSINY